MKNFIHYLCEGLVKWIILLLIVVMAIDTTASAKDKPATGPKGQLVGPKNFSYELLAGGKQRVNVNCDAGGSIQKAIWNAAPGGMLVINISGVCSEVVFINRDKVWLRGTDPKRDKIIGQGPNLQCAVNVAGAQSVYVEGLTITSKPGLSNSSGICAIHSAHVEVRNSIVEDNPDTGIFYSDSSSGDIKNTTVRHNRYGVNYRQCSAGDIFNTTVSDSTRCNFIVDQASAVRFWGGNQIYHSQTDSGRECAGVTVRHGSSLRIRGGNNKIEMLKPTKSTPNISDAGPIALVAHSNSNIRIGDGHLGIVGNVRAFNNSSIELYDVDINGNLYADGLNGTFHLSSTGSRKDNVTLTNGNIYLRRGSSIIFTSGDAVRHVRLDGNVVCVDQGYNAACAGSSGFDKVQFEKPGQKVIDCGWPE